MSRSDSYTNYSWYKQEVLRSVVEYTADEHNQLVTDRVRHDEYVFVDAHGGLGMWVDTNGRRCLGSPVLTYRTLERMGVNYRGFVFEKSEARYDLVRAHTSFSQWPVTCFNMDNCNAPRIISDFYQCGSGAYVNHHNPYGESRAVELGGLIYYDNKGVGKASEIEQLTRDNRLDVLLHFSAGKRSVYAHCNNPEGHTYSQDRNIIGNIPQYHRPYWYITDCHEGEGNRWNFLFLFGTHRELNLDRISDLPRFAPMYRFHRIDSPDGILCQHKAFYSREDMECYDHNTCQMNPNGGLTNTLPFRVVESGLPNQELVYEDSLGNRDDARQIVGEGSVSDTEESPSAESDESDFNPFI